MTLVGGICSSRFTAMSFAPNCLFISLQRATRHNQQVAPPTYLHFGRAAGLVRLALLWCRLKMRSLARLGPLVGPPDDVTRPPPLTSARTSGLLEALLAHGRHPEQPHRGAPLELFAGAPAGHLLLLLLLLLIVVRAADLDLDRLLVV